MTLTTLLDTDRCLEDTLIDNHSTLSLTKREAEILDLILEGHTNKAIAQQLHRTERTVEYHRHRLMRKFNARTAAELVRKAIRRGLA